MFSNYVLPRFEGLRRVHCNTAPPTLTTRWRDDPAARFKARGRYLKPRFGCKPALLSFHLVLVAFLACTAASHADIIYVSNWNNSTIQRFDSVTHSNLGIFANPGGPRGITLDGAGNLYAVIYTISSVMKYTPDGVASVFVSGLAGPESLAFDPAGNLYVANRWDNTIVTFTRDGTGSFFASTGSNEPSGLAFDKAGNLFVATGRGNTIEKFTPGGVGSVFATDLKYPRGLTFDKAGNLFVANFWGPSYGTASIVKFTAEGVGSVFATGGPTSPAELAFDSAGNLYVA